jgi:hypothetical protein
MRSNLIFGAAKHIPNRFLLVRALAKAARGLHKPGTRIQDTMNDVLTRFEATNPIAPHDAVPTTEAVRSSAKKTRHAQPRNSNRALVSPIRETPHPAPETIPAQETRKRA